MIKLGRDSFARHDITRRQVDGTCSFCGCTNRRGKVYVFTVRPDSIINRDYDIKGKFCSIGCLNAYHGY